MKTIIKEADNGIAKRILDKTYKNSKIDDILWDETNWELGDTNVEHNFI